MASHSVPLARTHDEGAAVAAVRRRTPPSGAEGRQDRPAICQTHH
jgi:hypothetical protein